MILSGKEIKKLIKAGDIKVKPFDPKLIGAGSLDLRLGNSFRVFKKQTRTVSVKGNVDFSKGSKIVKLKKDEAITLWPGEFMHSTTLEELDLPANIAGWLEGRSSLARLGVTVHTTSGFVHPGSKGKQVLEMSNVSNSPVELVPGTPICQIVLEEVKNPGKKYSGKFSGQKQP